MYKIAEGLVEGTFLNRPNRFIVIAEIGGEEIRCHIANPGRMKELLVPGRILLIKRTDDRSRRTAGSVLAVLVDDEVVQLNSNLVAKLIPWGLEEMNIPGMRGWRILQREYIVVGEKKTHRLDYVLQDEEGGKVYTEVKSTTLVRDQTACFPDAVSARASSHLDLLMEFQRGGKTAMALFIVYRESAQFAPCSDIDPVFAEKFREASRTGVRFKAVLVRTTVRTEGRGTSLYADFVRELPVQRG